MLQREEFFEKFPLGNITATNGPSDICVVVERGYTKFPQNLLTIFNTIIWLGFPKTLPEYVKNRSANSYQHLRLPKMIHLEKQHKVPEISSQKAGIH